MKAKAKAKANVAASPVEKAQEALVQAQQALPADAPEALKAQTQASFTIARQDYDKAQQSVATLQQTASKFQVISKEASNFIDNAVSELRFGKGSDHDIYVDLQMWMINHKAKSFLIPEGLNKVKGSDGPKIFIDAHGNIIADSFVGNFFSFDPASLMLTYKILGGKMSLGKTISTGGVNITFDKQHAGIRIGNGEVSMNIIDFKVTEIGGKCQVFLVGDDPHSRVSINASGVVEIKPYVNPDVALERPLYCVCCSTFRGHKR